MSQKGKLVNKEAGLGKAGRIYLQIGDKKDIQRNMDKISKGINKTGRTTKISSIKSITARKNRSMTTVKSLRKLSTKKIIFIFICS